MTAWQALASPKFLLTDQLSQRFFPSPDAEMDFFHIGNIFLGRGFLGGKCASFRKLQTD